MSGTASLSDALAVKNGLKIGPAASYGFIASIVSSANAITPTMTNPEDALAINELFTPYLQGEGQTLGSYRGKLLGKTMKTNLDVVGAGDLTAATTGDDSQHVKSAMLGETTLQCLPGNLKTFLSAGAAQATNAGALSAAIDGITLVGGTDTSNTRLFINNVKSLGTKMKLLIAVIEALDATSAGADANAGFNQALDAATGITPGAVSEAITAMVSAGVMTAGSFESAALKIALLPVATAGITTAEASAWGAVTGATIDSSGKHIFLPGTASTTAALYQAAVLTGGATLANTKPIVKLALDELFGTLIRSGNAAASVGLSSYVQAALSQWDVNSEILTQLRNIVENSTSTAMKNVREILTVNAAKTGTAMGTFGTTKLCARIQKDTTNNFAAGNATGFVDNTTGTAALAFLNTLAAAGAPGVSSSAQMAIVGMPAALHIVDNPGVGLSASDLGTVYAEFWQSVSAEFTLPYSGIKLSVGSSTLFADYAAGNTFFTGAFTKDTSLQGFEVIPTVPVVSQAMQLTSLSGILNQLNNPVRQWLGNRIVLSSAATTGNFQTAFNIMGNPTTDVSTVSTATANYFDLTGNAPAAASNEKMKQLLLESSARKLGYSQVKNLMSVITGTAHDAANGASMYGYFLTVPLDASFKPYVEGVAGETVATQFGYISSALAGNIYPNRNWNFYPGASTTSSTNGSTEAQRVRGVFDLSQKAGSTATVSEFVSKNKTNSVISGINDFQYVDAETGETLPTTTNTLVQVLNKVQYGMTTVVAGTGDVEILSFWSFISAKGSYTVSNDAAKILANIIRYLQDPKASKDIVVVAKMIDGALAILKKNTLDIGYLAKDDDETYYSRFSTELGGTDTVNIIRSIANTPNIGKDSDLSRTQKTRLFVIAKMKFGNLQSSPKLDTTALVSNAQVIGALTDILPTGEVSFPTVAPNAVFVASNSGTGNEISDSAVKTALADRASGTAASKTTFNFIVAIYRALPADVKAKVMPSTFIIDNSAGSGLSAADAKRLVQEVFDLIPGDFDGSKRAIPDALSGAGYVWQKLTALLAPNANRLQGTSWTTSQRAKATPEQRNAMLLANKTIALVAPFDITSAQEAADALKVINAMCPQDTLPSYYFWAKISNIDTIAGATIGQFGTTSGIGFFFKNLTDQLNAARLHFKGSDTVTMASSANGILDKIFTNAGTQISGGYRSRAITETQNNSIRAIAEALYALYSVLSNDEKDAFARKFFTNNNNEGQVCLGIQTLGMKGGIGFTPESLVKCIDLFSADAVIDGASFWSNRKSAGDDNEDTSIYYLEGGAVKALFATRIDNENIQSVDIYGHKLVIRYNK